MYRCPREEKTMNDLEMECQMRALNEMMQQILSLDSPQAYSMIATVNRYIQYSGLYSQVQPADILNEAYWRAEKATRQGTHIRSCRAWIKGTCRFIVFELARQQRRERPTDPQSAALETSYEPENECEERWDRNFAILRQAFESLRQNDPETAELLDWRILKKLSWLKVRERLRAEGREVPTEEALRQRASRANRKLRRLFHELGGEYEMLQS